jgi:F0F1-type ATP synthase epsilon subunit
MHLKIYTMRRTVYEGDTSRVTLPTEVGEVTILDHHEPYVTILQPGSLRYDVPTSVELPQSHEKSPIRHGENKLEIKGGFLEVREGNEVRVLADE